jgi:lipoyl(octanoyl) transferase
MYWARTTRRKPPWLEVYLLGLLEFEEALRLQRRLVYEVSGASGKLAALVLCEHEPIITVGRRGSRSHIACDDDELDARGLALRWVNRGGGCCLHLPGQLAAYPILPFDPDSLSISAYMRRLERCVLRVLREFGVRATTRDDHSGLWTPSGQIASIGVAVSRWVSYYGLTLNVAGRREPFRILHPEGNGSLRATTLEAERQRPTPMSKVRECLVCKFVESFGLCRFNLFTSHPALHCTKRSTAYVHSV